MTFRSRSGLPGEILAASSVKSVMESEPRSTACTAKGAGWGVLVLLMMGTRVATAMTVEPIAESVVDGKLTVRVYPHVLSTQTGRLPVWTYVSDGLLAKKQPEVRITVKREPKESPADYPRDLLALYRTIYDLAGQGRLVDVGGITELGSRGLLGRDDFRCVLYVPAQAFEDVPVAAPSLTALIVTCNEAQAARRYGLLRTMARLGAVNRFYPTTPWADRARKEVIGSDGNAGSLLEKVAPVAVGARFRLEGDAHRVIFSLLPDAKAALPRLLARAPRGPIALSLLLDPHADACLVWQPGQREPAAITPPGGTGSAVSATYVILMAGGERDSGKLIEDGFVLQLTETSWGQVRGALERGKPLSLPLGETQLEIEWIPTTYDDPIGHATYHAPLGFDTYKPSQPALPSTGPIALEQVVLLTPNDEMPRHLSVEALAKFVQLITATVTTEATATPAKQAAGMMLDFTGDDQNKTFKLAFKPAIPSPFAERLQARLDKLTPPPMQNGPIHFQVVFRIGVRGEPPH
jgi:hypothetical protein